MIKNKKECSKMREQTIKTICNELLKETNVFVFDVFDETITQKKEIAISFTNGLNMKTITINKEMKNISVSDLRNAVKKVA
jgi:hypothetical protein